MSFDNDNNQIKFSENKTDMNTIYSEKTDNQNKTQDMSILSKFIFVFV